MLDADWEEIIGAGWMFCNPQKQIYGTVFKNIDHMFIWEARVPSINRICNQPIIGKVQTLRMAKTIVEDLLVNMGILIPYITH